MIQLPVTRHPQCNNPRSVSKYIQIIESMLDKADTSSAIMKLEDNDTVPITDDAMEAYKEFDKTITIMMVNA